MRTKNKSPKIYLHAVLTEGDENGVKKVVKNESFDLRSGFTSSRLGVYFHDRTLLVALLSVGVPVKVQTFTSPEPSEIFTCLQDDGGWSFDVVAEF